MPVAPVPTVADLSTLCIEVLTGTGEMCITFPGGATICATAGIDTGDAGQIVKGFLATLGPALAPLMPFFNVMDVTKALGACVQAIPDCLGPTPTPEPILKCIPNLVKALDKLLQLVPQYTVPLLVKGALTAVITGLMATKQKLVAMVKQVERISAAATRAAQLGGGIGVELQGVVDCAQSNLDAQLQNENASLAPLNRLIGVLNILVKLVPGMPCIPTVGGLTALTADVFKPVDSAIKILQAIMAAIPGGLSLPAAPNPDDPC